MFYMCVYGSFGDVLYQKSKVVLDGSRKGRTHIMTHIRTHIMDNAGTQNT